jgi:gamma-glutamyl-gamma-aminobutyrate hydrolase PuuD
MFQDRGWEVMPVTIENIQNADLVQFTGGSDVTPALYGEKNTASDNSEPRDLMEIGVFGVAMAENIPMAGICRGGQFLNVMCGGKMHQHVDGHATGKMHGIITIDGDVISVTSTHHQMMIPGDNAVVLATAKIVGDEDTEIVYYPNDSVFCFQPHPEFSNGSCQDLYFNYLDKLFYYGDH